MSSYIDYLEASQHEIAQGAQAAIVKRLDVPRMAYALSLVAAMSAWITSLRAPLWLDECNSWWQISGGLSQIWARQGLDFPLYTYFLWAYAKVFGSGEATLRAPHLMIMAAAVYMFYKTARLLLAYEVAMFATIMFALHPIVKFAAIDVRPYAFAILTTITAIYWLLRWTADGGRRHAAFFGIACAFIFYFHYLFGCIMATVFAAYYFAVKRGDWRRNHRELLAALIPFAVLLVPAVTPLLFLVRTAEHHVFAPRPNWFEIVTVFNPSNLLITLALAFLLMLLFKTLGHAEETTRARLACVFFGVVPLLLLCAVSIYTPVHVFIDRYKLMAIPGVALCWGVWFSRIDSKWLRAAFCVFCVYSVLSTYELSLYGPHGYSWKDAITKVNKITEQDHAPVFMCSDLPESDFEQMPSDPLQSIFFAPISYYHMNSEVIALPRNNVLETKRQLEHFLERPKESRKRFVVMAFLASAYTMHWITDQTKNSYTPTKVGSFDSVTVMEFVLKDGPSQAVD